MSFGIWKDILALPPARCATLNQLLLNNRPNVIQTEARTMCQLLYPEDPHYHPLHFSCGKLKQGG